MQNKNKKTCKNLRLNLLKLTHQVKSSHLGSCLSIVEILTVLYNNVLRKKIKIVFFLAKDMLVLPFIVFYMKKKL